KIHDGFPAGFAHEFLAGKRVATVVSWTILHVCDQALRLSGGGQHLPYYVEIRQGAVAADVVDLAVATFAQNGQNATAMIVHIQPVANLLPVAVNRQGL